MSVYYNNNKNYSYVRKKKKKFCAVAMIPATSSGLQILCIHHTLNVVHE